MTAPARCTTTLSMNWSPSLRNWASMSDIFESDCQAIVNTVNCVGVMGKGLAKQFKERYPAMFCDYRIACQHGRLDPGRVYGWYDPDAHLIYNFTTKNDWRKPSLL